MRVAVPLETKNRELDGKIWLSVHLLSRGHEIVIGHHPVVTSWFDKLKPDVYISDSAGGQRPKLDRFQALQSNDVSVMILDNEGGILRKISDLECRISLELLECTDQYFAWGSRQAEAIQELTNISDDKLVVTGVPKLDLLQEAYRDYFLKRAEKKRDQYGEYILVATSFGLANHYDNTLVDELYESDDILRLSKPENQLKYRPVVEELLEEFLAAIPAIAETFPDLTFVVRPHPSENRQTYEDAFSEDSNIAVSNVGSVHEWLHGATAVVHNNSSVGVEGILMNRPTIAFAPVIDENYDLILPNAMSRTATDTETLRKELDRARGGGDILSEFSEAQHELLKSYIDNVDTVAAEKIADKVDEATPADWTGPVRHTVPFRLKRQLKHRAPPLFRLAKSGKNLLDGRPDRSEYTEQKFPGITAPEIEDRIERLAALDDRFDTLSPTVRQVAGLPNCYVLKP